MEHDINITSIALVVVAALLSGLGLARLGQPPILGYILSGIFLGPSGFAVIDSRDQVSVLAELGVLLLLFVVGMELNLRTFKKVWFKATVYTIAQIALSVSIMMGLSPWLGSNALALLLGFVISLSSTAVVVKMMESIGESKTEVGQLTIGVLICQDLAIVPMILILRNYQTSLFTTGMFVKLFLSVALIIALITYLSRKERVRLPLAQIVAGERELTPLASLTFCFGAAAITGLMGLSAPYGSFLAGLVLGNTRERLIMIETTKPIQNILMMAFFLSIGLLLDLGFIWKHLGSIALLLFTITIAKTAFNIGLLRALRLPWSQAFLVGVLLAQLGEFSFLMATVAYESKLVTGIEERLIVSLTVLSLSFSPLWMLSARRLKEFANRAHMTLRNSIQGYELPFIKRLWNIVRHKKLPPPSDT